MSTTRVAFLLFVFLTHREEELKTFGVLPSEMEEMKMASEKHRLNLNALGYFVTCAKMPYYMTKVQKGLKHSFVDAGVSLYYTERFYLFSSLAKLTEVWIGAGSES